jgi:hypothetical protein
MLFTALCSPGESSQNINRRRPYDKYFEMQIFQDEVTFLEYVINQIGVRLDPERVAAILRYPAPRNQKNLRQFLGTFDFHNEFIVGYENYVGQFLPLMKKGGKCTWTGEMQAAFQSLSEQFTSSIHLVHSDTELPYCVYTEACKHGISGILMQKHHDR